MDRRPHGPEPEATEWKDPQSSPPGPYFLPEEARPGVRRASALLKPRVRKAGCEGQRGVNCTPAPVLMYKSCLQKARGDLIWKPRESLWT